MRILMIAPRVAGLPELPNLPDEIAAVTSQHRVELLIGNVKERDIAKAAVSDTFDIIWFATHAGPDGISLTDTVLRESAVISFVRISGAHLCVLNTCESEGLAQAIMEQVDIDVIATIVRLDAEGVRRGLIDNDAMLTGIMFSRALLTSTDFRQAYEQARPGGNHSYKYIASYRPFVVAPPWWRWLVVAIVAVVLLLAVVLVFSVVFHG